MWLLKNGNHLMLSEPVENSLRDLPREGGRYWLLSIFLSLRPRNIITRVIIYYFCKVKRYT